MKANAKYTALEILQAAGVPEPEGKIGKVRVRIAGIAGIVKPDRLIRFQAGTEGVEVIVGVESYDLVLEGGGEQTEISEAAHAALEVKGKEATRKSEELQDARAEVEESEE